MAIRLRLREILEDRGMTQTELQLLTRLGYSSINAMYHNKTERVEFDTLDALCVALKIQPGELLEYVPDRSRRGTR
jgi:putative transcriptional regulator